LPDIIQELQNTVHRWRPVVQAKDPDEYARAKKNLSWLQDISSLVSSRFTELIAAKTVPVLAAVNRRKAQHERYALLFPDEEFGDKMLEAADEVAKFEIRHSLKQTGARNARESKYADFFTFGTPRDNSRRNPEAEGARRDPPRDRPRGRQTFDRSRERSQSPGRDASQRDGATRYGTPFRSAESGGTSRSPARSPGRTDQSPSDRPRVAFKK
jgi:hypothetical protein